MSSSCSSPGCTYWTWRGRRRRSAPPPTSAAATSSATSESRRTSPPPRASPSGRPWTGPNSLRTTSSSSPAGGPPPSWPAPARWPTPRDVFIVTMSAESAAFDAHAAWLRKLLGDGLLIAPGPCLCRVSTGIAIFGAASESEAQRSSATPPCAPGYPGCFAAAKRDMRSSETSKVPSRRQSGDRVAVQIRRPAALIARRAGRLPRPEDQPARGPPCSPRRRLLSPRVPVAA